MKRIWIIWVFPFVLLFFLPSGSICGESDDSRRQVEDVEATPVFTNRLGMTFILIRPGSFAMGSPLDEPGRDSDELQHRVTLSKPFYLQTTEVTQGQWRKIMGNNPSHFSHCGDDCPVETVSWHDAQAFIRRLNTMQKDLIRYRLPTEAEWEYAARAGSDTALANGAITVTGCDPDPNLNRMGWYCGNSDHRTHRVALKMPNAWGLYDMHGNVWEWCQDWYGDYKAGPVVDPKGPQRGLIRTNRGGSWWWFARFCRSANRIRYMPFDRIEDLGFRLAGSMRR
jgi:formylglycine-generating enzyme required for sulfatase activity